MICIETDDNLMVVRKSRANVQKQCRTSQLVRRWVSANVEVIINETGLIRPFAIDAKDRLTTDMDYAVPTHSNHIVCY